MMSKTWINKYSESNENHQAFIEIQNQCPLCGTDVEIEVERDNSLEIQAFKLKEQAFCPKCNTKTRQKEHSWH